MLDLSKIEAGHFVLDRRPLVLHDLLDSHGQSHLERGQVHRPWPDTGRSLRRPAGPAAGGVRHRTRGGRRPDGAAFPEVRATRRVPDPPSWRRRSGPFPLRRPRRADEGRHSRRTSSGRGHE
uniref:DUF4158 domain-containing protein n=1 Tax=Parastrongyloides trichosuri TaxID=131310 RepID=A0A0N4Z8K9_PARTI